MNAIEAANSIRQEIKERGVIATEFAQRAGFSFSSGDEAGSSEFGRIVYCGLIGSHAHGTHIPPEDPNGIDDVDVFLVIAPPAERVIGLHEWEHLQFWSGSFDVTCFSVKKFAKLLVKSNPNVLGVLWGPDDCSIYVPHEWENLRNNRMRFSSKLAIPSFHGYAHGQLKKMVGGAYEGYMGAKRKALVDKHGFDTKNAAHCMRLLRMGIEFIQTGQLNVRRKDAQELIDIKQGKWSQGRIIQEATDLLNIHLENDLPERPDEKWLDNWLVNTTYGRLYP